TVSITKFSGGESPLTLPASSLRRATITCGPFASGAGTVNSYGPSAGIVATADPSISSVSVPTAGVVPVNLGVASDVIASNELNPVSLSWSMLGSSVGVGGGGGSIVKWEFSPKLLSA